MKNNLFLKEKTAEILMTIYYLKLKPQEQSTATNIAFFAGITYAFVHQRIKVFEEVGLVNRIPIDKKRVQIKLTKKGELIAESLIKLEKISRK